MALVDAAFLAPMAAAPPAGGALAPAVSVRAPEATGSATESAMGVSAAALASAALVLGGAAAIGGSKRRRASGQVARRVFNGFPFSREVAPPKPQGALAIPMLPEPEYRRLKDPYRVEMDAGFDPLALATKASPWGSAEDAYYNYREAEVKHGRLAMLAAVGWLSSETFQGVLAQRWGLKDDLAPGELAPSLLNGGLADLPSWFLPAVVVVSGWIELVPRMRGNRASLLKYKPEADRIPGDLDFDPLALRPQLAAVGYGVEQLHNAEVKHGRAAMIAITAFVAQEFFAGVDVLTEDEISVDRIVSTVDRGIDAVDKAAGLAIPDIPLPFPGL